MLATSSRFLRPNSHLTTKPDSEERIWPQRKKERIRRAEYIRFWPNAFESGRIHSSLAECIRIYSRPNAFFLRKGLRKPQKHYSLKLFYNNIMEHCICDAVWNYVTLTSALADSPAPSWTFARTPCAVAYARHAQLRRHAVRSCICTPGAPACALSLELRGQLRT